MAPNLKYHVCFLVEEEGTDGFHCYSSELRKNKLGGNLLLWERLYSCRNIVKRSSNN